MAKHFCPNQNCQSPDIALVVWSKAGGGTDMGIQCEACGLSQVISDHYLIEAALLTYENEESNREGNI